MVAPMAMAMPIMPYTLPRRADSWWLRPPRLRMHRMLAARYALVTIPGFMCSPSLPEHLQHALGDEEPAGDVDRGDENGHGRQQPDDELPGVDLEQGADHADA